VPGVLKEINRIISDLGANITGQYLATDSEIGYLIIELDHLVSERAKDEISKLPASIRTRILY
jgi:D-3-phosphoglycerate dehydrogenase